ncbi:MAG: Polymer-forming cytoskeletal [Syntrophaceae bacterium PtaU1.Bin231]|nr:MAG: Polymer-forming cytoskeletal [Syntrophaceae bacterium PtaU1.Bin231]HOG18423.1 polymer-forming cytoskeletal protein [Syntrophales bacterium]
MMGHKKTKDDEIKAFLGKGARFCGKLIFTGAVRIDGDYQGEIFGEGSLIIGEGALVEADIAAESVSISGEVRGKIDVTEKLEIYATGRLWGDVTTPVFVIKEGAIFDGLSKMKEAVAGKRPEIQKAAA